MSTVAVKDNPEIMLDRSKRYLSAFTLSAAMSGKTRLWSKSTAMSGLMSVGRLNLELAYKNASMFGGRWLRCLNLLPWEISYA
jgi:hypothetical protein